VFDIADYVFKSARLFDEGLSTKAGAERGEALAQFAHSALRSGGVAERYQHDDDAPANGDGE
jgi:hypothetical protein